MPKHLYLPELEGNIGEPPVAGVWHGYQRRLLRSVSDGIVVGQGAIDRGVSSVPDAWARPLMFQNALRPGSGHPMRARAVQEWRGLLSLLALHKLQQYDVDVVPLALTGARAGAEASREFVRALLRLLPAPVALEHNRPPYEWSDTLLVHFDGIPVGAFSPTTLVYTAVDYNRRLAATTLNLKDAQGFLAPPGADQREELRYVATWVEQLHDRLNAPNNPAAAILDTGTTDPTARDAVRTINGLLDEWLDELRATLGVGRGDRFEAKDVEVDPELIEVRPAATFLDGYRVYQALLHPLRRSAAGAGTSYSDLLLEPRRNRSGRDHVVVITPALLRTNNKIWQSRRLVHLGGDATRAIEENFDAAAGWGQQVEREDLRPANAIWIRPERYFLTDTLTATDDASPLLAPGWQALNGDAHLLLPFTPRILDFFSPTDIRELLRPEYRKVENGITFSFQLPVAGRMERVQKTYRSRNSGADEGRLETMAAVPPVEIFPRYIDAAWRRYYVFQGGAERVLVQPVVPATCTVTERTHSAPESPTTARAVEIAGEGAYPEALVFTPAEPNAPAASNGNGAASASGASNSTAAVLGLALVPRPPEPPGLAGEWRIGIDFGTSNTNVFRQSTATNLAERWRFDFPAYLFDVTAPHPERDTVLRAFFVPPEPVELPIPTALRVFEDARKTHGLLDYAIFFSAQYEVPRNVHADIKWDGEEELNTKPFLKSLLFLLLIEVGLQRVSRVTLACSYPKAYSLSLRSRYEGAWESVVKELLDDPATAVFLRHQRAGSTGPEVSDPEFHTEGVAAGEFFASEMTIPDLADRANKQIAAVALDVGGGTTDISIWHRNAIVFDASVLLAGRQISRLLQQSPRVLEVLFSPEAVRALEQKRNEPTAFAARLNVILKREEAAVRERLIDHANNREVQWIRRILAVEFGAIAFYTASLLGAVNERMGGELARSIETRAIRLHWGGNAAKLINWIDFGRYDESGIASKMLNALLFNGLKDVPVKLPAALLAQKQSPGHKSEAAGGLVVMRALAHSWRDGGALAVAQGGPGEDDGFDMPSAVLGTGDADGSDLDMPDEGAASAAAHGFSPDIVSGENIDLTTGPVGHLGMISGRALFDGPRTRFRGTSLDRLTRFVEIVNYFGVRFGLFTDDSKIVLDARRQGQIADAVLAQFVEAERLREGQRVIEPVFITEVKLLLDILRNELR